MKDLQMRSEIFNEGRISENKKKENDRYKWQEGKNKEQKLVNQNEVRIIHQRQKKDGKKERKTIEIKK